MKIDSAKAVQRYAIALTFLVVVMIVGFIIMVSMYRDIKSLKNTQPQTEIEEESKVVEEANVQFFDLKKYFADSKLRVVPLESPQKLEGDVLLRSLFPDDGLLTNLYEFAQVLDADNKVVGSFVHVFQEGLGEWFDSTWFVQGERLVLFTNTDNALFGNTVKRLSGAKESVAYDTTTRAVDLYQNYEEPSEVQIQNGIILQRTEDVPSFSSGFALTSFEKDEPVFLKDGIALYEDSNGIYWRIRPDFGVVYYRAPGPAIVPKNYELRGRGGCGFSMGYASFPEGVTVTMADLVPYKYARPEDGLYVFKNKNHKILKDWFEQSYTEMSYEQFIEKDPIIVWKDAFDVFRPMHSTLYGPQAECGKPVIYLYPEETQEISVKVEPEGGFSFTEPLYNDGWKVTATPEGAITNLADGKTYPYLFWEGTGGTYEAPKTGFVVAKVDVEKTLREKLSYMGLNEKEIADFVEFWLPRMQAHPYYVIGFHGTHVMDYLAPLTISPKPDSVFRILMDYRGVPEPIEIEEPMLPQFKRKGFAVVEWGGVLQRVGDR